MPIPPTAEGRRRRIFAAESLDALLAQPDGEDLLKQAAKDPAPVLTEDHLAYLTSLRDERRKSVRRFGALFSTDDVIVVPGFMGSTLRDAGDHGLIWIDPRLFLGEGGEQLAHLQLGKFDKAADADETDFGHPGVQVQSLGVIPAIYDLLALDLEIRRYDVQMFPFDWRKDLERAARRLADKIRGRLGRKPRPLHLVAHSQGSLVARRALQLVGPDEARRLVKTLVLLGPASFGSFSAAFALAGVHESIQTLRDLGVRMPENMGPVLSTFTGAYQLLPWNPATADFPLYTVDPGDGNPHVPLNLEDLAEDPSTPEFEAAAKAVADAFGTVGADPARVEYGFRWGARIDTAFFNDRTTIILGDQPTVGGVRFENDTVVSAGEVWGDGTVPDLCAVLPGVRAFRAAGAEHLKLPLNRAALAAVRAVLRGDPPRLRRDGTLAAAPGDPRARLRAASDKALQSAHRDAPADLAEPAKPRQDPQIIPPRPAPPETFGPRPLGPALVTRPEPPHPPCRRLRVFSFDPLLATDLSLLDIAAITIPIPWEEPGRVLGPGPVGEYLEVVDADPTSGCFYHPVDIGDPRLMATDGLEAAESDPQFHQQMTYAVAMGTIATFEKALGRVALWAPRLLRDEADQVVSQPPDAQFVRRLRVYPHALREANAFYDPDRHALLFGYFPSREAAGGATRPGGTVFTCQSFDVIAHETTHALLHGLHRYYLYASNPDVFAFHEAFADAVALFQHFSHTEVVRHQVAKTRGDLRRGALLGHLAWQFGQALGEHRGALRSYLGHQTADGQWVERAPDPTLYHTADKPHDRGAVLMAALFQAFVNIYESRTRDLYRIATGGTGRLPDGDIHPDLVNRLSVEAATSARHLLNMCVRALDYVPAVDLTFGEYLRALITADYDLVKNDDRGYRAAVIDAFRKWGIYPPDVTVLDEAALRWRPPPVATVEAVREAILQLQFGGWNLRADRRTVFLQMQKNGEVAHYWIQENARSFGDDGQGLGLVLGGAECMSVRRSKKTGFPVFAVHSLRPCTRVGPDGQQRVDLVAELLQRRAGFFDPAVQREVDAGKRKWTWYEKEAEADPTLALADFTFRGGCTLVIDPESGQIRYCVRKSIRSDTRLDRQRDFELNGALPGLAATYLGGRSRTPFAMLHGDE